MLDKHGNEITVLDELLQASKAALAALESPGDLTEDERRYIAEDLIHAIDRAEQRKENQCPN